MSINPKPPPIGGHTHIGRHHTGRQSGPARVRTGRLPLTLRQPRSLPGGTALRGSSQLRGASTPTA
jgi:hypothetical protein